MEIGMFRHNVTKYNVYKDDIVAFLKMISCYPSDKDTSESRIFSDIRDDVERYTLNYPLRVYQDLITTGQRGITYVAMFKDVIDRFKDFLCSDEKDEEVLYKELIKRIVSALYEGFDYRFKFSPINSTVWSKWYDFRSSLVNSSLTSSGEELTREGIVSKVLVSYIVEKIYL